MSRSSSIRTTPKLPKMPSDYFRSNGATTFQEDRVGLDLAVKYNLVDNFNDDGLECGPKLRAHTLFISQNRIGACLIPLTQHEMLRRLNR